MISERQTDFLISECEKATGQSLDQLRIRLSKDDDRLANLWELIVLYCTLPLGRVSSGLCDEIPDVHIDSDNCESFWIESSFLHPKDIKRLPEIDKFPKWIRKSLEAEGISFARKVNIDIAKINKSKPVVIPRENEWKSLKKSSSWASFVSEAGVSSCASGSLIFPSGNLIVRLEGIGRLPYTRGPSIDSPKLERHPVFGKIREKARQARKWKKKGTCYTPLVLVLGASEDLARAGVWNDGYLTLNRVVSAALIDTGQMSLSVKLNITGSLDSKRVSVPGARYISAVIIVAIETVTRSFLPGCKRVAKPKLFIENPQADISLSPAQKNLIGLLNFNRIEYKHEWET